MHWFGLLLLPDGINDIELATQEHLALFDLNLEVELHKEYFRFWQVNLWREYLKTDDLVLIAEGVKKTPLGHEEIGLDEQGIYRITTHNSQSQWDSWRFAYGELLTGKERWKNCLVAHQVEPHSREPAVCNQCPVSELPEDILPVSVIAPDGIWHDIDDFLDHSQTDRQVTDPQTFLWRKQVRALLDQYDDHIAVGIDFHG